HVEDQTGEAQFAFLWCSKCIEQCAATEQEVERVTHRPIDRLDEKGLGETQIAEVAPVDERPGRRVANLRRHPRHLGRVHGSIRCRTQSRAPVSSAASISLAAIAQSRSRARATASATKLARSAVARNSCCRAGSASTRA